MLRKLLICPWFGPLPTWYKHWAANVQELAADGYDVFVTHDEAGFASRVRDTLGITYPGGGYKLCDYRCAFGLLYADELQGYSHWGTTDLDVVYGRVTHFLNDTRLAGLDQWSNHPTYVSGPWSLYKNAPHVNELFMAEPDWRGYLEEPETSGWVEMGYSKLVAANLQHLWTNWQTSNLDNFDLVHFDKEGRLKEGMVEIMMAHWRRTKVYPPNVLENAPWLKENAQ